MGNVKKYQMCSRCILDTTVPEILFDENGVCNYCKLSETVEKKFPLDEVGKEKFDKLINDIKSKASNKSYDCIIGVSGGVDSSYTLFTIATKLHLLPVWFYEKYAKLDHSKLRKEV